MKKKSNKLANLERNRTSIITDNMSYCYLCGRPKQHIHEIIHGSNRQNSMIYGLTIPVCFNCHTNIHNNSTLDKQLKALAQNKFEETYDIDFITIFKKNYL